MKASILVVIGTLICCIITAATGLVCYKCTGGGASLCNDPPDLSYITQGQCELNQVCVKLSNDYFVKRICGDRSICTSQINNDWKRCEVCDEDLCNTAPTDEGNIFVTVMFASFVLAGNVAIW